MNKKEVYSDCGSVKFIHRRGAAFLVSHGGGDGCFEVYVGNSRDELFNKLLGDGVLKYADAWLSDGSGWRVMLSDCAADYNAAFVFELRAGLCNIYINKKNNSVYLIYA